MSFSLAEDRVGVIPTALDAYIAAPDPTYRFEALREIPDKEHGFTGHVLKLVSQTWRNETEVDRPVWEHDLTIIVPDKVEHDTALLFIGGGKNGREAPTKVKTELAEVALATKSVVVELGQVPNQTLVFADDPTHRERTEDDLIAYTWDKFMRGGDPTWLARFPMTKSAVRAMDTVTTYCAGLKAPVDVKSFVVAGGSKRGWTTWMTAAVDKRVKGIVPIVIDMLNVRPSFQHHHEAYGEFSPAVDDYVNGGIMDWQDTPEYAKLLKLVEPYEYRGRFTMPKLMLNASGDQFFLPDSSQFYYNDLIGPKALRYVPNADHSLKGSDAYKTLMAFYGLILTDTPMPQYSWKGDEHQLVVSPKTKPKEARLWKVTNPKARDFRLAVVGPAWKDEMLEPQNDGTFLADVPEPTEGWTAFFVEMTFDTPAKAPLKLTTEVKVTPKNLPFGPYIAKPIPGR